MVPEDALTDFEFETAAALLAMRTAVAQLYANKLAEHPEPLTYSRSARNQMQRQLKDMHFTGGNISEEAESRLIESSEFHLGLLFDQIDGLLAASLPMDRPDNLI